MEGRGQLEAVQRVAGVFCATELDEGWAVFLRFVNPRRVGGDAVVIQDQVLVGIDAHVREVIGGPGKR